MEVLLAISVFTLLVVLVVMVPRWTTPYCPICDARLESTGESEEIGNWLGWHWVSRRFVCTECMYRRTRVEFVRHSQEIKT